jgi:hypothetical protein
MFVHITFKLRFLLQDSNFNFSYFKKTYYCCCWCYPEVKNGIVRSNNSAALQLKVLECKVCVRCIWHHSTFVRIKGRDSSRNLAIVKVNLTFNINKLQHYNYLWYVLDIESGVKTDCDFPEHSILSLSITFLVNIIKFIAWYKV